MPQCATRQKYNQSGLCSESLLTHWESGFHIIHINLIRFSIIQIFVTHISYYTRPCIGTNYYKHPHTVHPYIYCVHLVLSFHTTHTFTNPSHLPSYATIHAYSMLAHIQHSLTHTPLPYSPMSQNANIR